ncbi:unnamed protein product [Brassicogethes aeneus]|uniref:Succinate dehydrogenase cytochrome b560 subunit, mitochondrial n=1 Tax=Brassicogethes aeneus TaxID=1431903 RepID=A0A9P0B2H8_BRAAE|nr:unnamed protein product [Brassicogethes aeneus]
MSLIFRLAGRQACNQFLKNEKTGLLNFIRPVTLQAKPAQPPVKEGHDERNMRLKRPQSPHLTIYAPQLTSMLSISHRATGMVLGAYAVGLGMGALVFPDDIPCWVEALECYNPALLTSVKFMLSFPLTYHFWNGIRHLIWDTGKFLTIKEVYLTGYAMLALAISTSIALTVM